MTLDPTNTTVHVVAPFHSRLAKELWSRCAFTQITLKQIEIFRRIGCRVVDYSNFGSESIAHEHVEVLSPGVFEKFFVDDGVPGHKSVIGSPGWEAWYASLRDRMKLRVASSPGMHIVAHTFADSARGLLADLPSSVMHFESHVGYDRPPFGAKRVFVSDAWRHYHFGKYGSEVGDRRWSWVIHPYYEAADWPFQPSPSGDYIAFMGRITPDKGVSTIQAIAKARPDWHFKVAGSGSLSVFEMPSNVEHVGVIPGNERAAFLGNAMVHILPTEYVEPCAGSVIEGMFCGTPAVTSSWGGFTETVIPNLTGYTSSLLADWIQNIERVKRKCLSRDICADYARKHFSLEAAVVQYRRVLADMVALAGRAWYDGVTEGQVQSSRGDLITPAGLGNTTP